MNGHPVIPLPETILARIRLKFYRMEDEVGKFAQGPTGRRFHQEKRDLLAAIAFPAVHLKERYGVNTPEALSSQILDTVIDTIVAKGAKIKKRFSIYFLHCVQEHMKHHGEEYYEQAKAALRAAETLPAVLRQVRVGDAQRSTDVMLGLHRALQSRGGRKSKPAPAQPLLRL